MPKTEKVTEDPETWRGAFRSHRRTRSSCRGHVWPEAALTVSWEASRLKVGRQRPWGGSWRTPAPGSASGHCCSLTEDGGGREVDPELNARQHDL